MSEDDDPRPPIDNKAFNDPEAWGFCDVCAFEVAVFGGRLGEHLRFRNPTEGEGLHLCRGAYKEPINPTPVEAWAKIYIDLVKSMSRQTSRRFWQQKRWKARAGARSLKPVRVLSYGVTLVTPDSPEEVDDCE
jgi:hypothetical protein